MGFVHLGLAGMTVLIAPFIRLWGHGFVHHGDGVPRMSASRAGDPDGHGQP